MTLSSGLWFRVFSQLIRDTEAVEPSMCEYEGRAVTGNSFR